MFRPLLSLITAAALVVCPWHCWGECAMARNVEHETSSAHSCCGHHEDAAEDASHDEHDSDDGHDCEHGCDCLCCNGAPAKGENVSAKILLAFGYDLACVANNAGAVATVALVRTELPGDSPPLYESGRALRSRIESLVI